MIYARRLDDIPLFADEADIARAVLGPGRVAEWRAMAVVLEREGLPRVDPMMGRRCWPAVREWFTKRPAPARATPLPPPPTKVGATKGQPPGDAPGLKWRSRKKGRAAYWVARHDIVKKGYRPETVRIHFNPQEPDHLQEIAARCRVLQQEMLTWAGEGRAAAETRPHDGSMASLIRLYQTDEASPYRDIKWNTRRTYDQIVRYIETSYGLVALHEIGIRDIRRWYDQAKAPKDPRSPETTRKAHGVVTMLRRLFGYGVMAEVPECERLARIMAEARFKQPARRRERLDASHVTAFIASAIESGRLSLALGTAIQFETTLRQRDVIGEWLIDDGTAANGVVHKGRRWSDGLTFENISGTVIRKRTSKTGKVVEHDLSDLPDTLAELDLIPVDRRTGPIVLNEETGLPYTKLNYIKWFRIIARKVGLPDEVWNMDARAGAVTEALDAGAQPNDVMNAAGHTQLSTTQGYDRTSLQKASRVAKLRVASRRKSNSSGQPDPA
ncbi:hypothetical protein FHT36_001922 [Xanthobacter sp. SG618]|uniref:integrase n=1 Tax=Xanthobacter sp. SG618 TaxID=2587121 RepID=UPI0017B8547D|nr:integrase [Xanthobacter sp. SG618]NMN58020.1 hypothetical protein [Xanthobacter sp. SG618]